MPSPVPGAIAFVFLLAAAVTYPVSLVILAVYRRAVRRSMRQRNQPERARHTASTMTPDGPAELLSGDPAALVSEMRRRPWMVAGAYAAAGLAYGAAMAAVWLTNSAEWGGTIRFVLLATIFAWPAVLTTGIVATSSRRAHVAISMAYLAGLVVLGWVGALGAPEGLLAGLLPWAMFNGPATILMLAFLSRRIRAVGPLVFAFTLPALSGAVIIFTLLAASDDLLRAALVLLPDDLGPRGALLALTGTGALLFTTIAWAVLQWIRRCYEAKVLSDEAVSVAALWLTFAVAHAIYPLLQPTPAVLLTPLPFAAFVLVFSVTLSRMGPYRGTPPQLLLLRSFAIGTEGERLFDALEKHWRRVGSIQMIAGYDLASRTVEPHELLDFVTGKLARRFIDGPETLERRLREMDLAPDRDGRFRVNDFFCYDDAWRMVLSTLVGRSHAVLMDLRGFTRANAGCIFEIQALGRTMAIEQVVFVIDTATDEPLLQSTLRVATADAGAIVEPEVFRLDTLTPRSMNALLELLATAAHHPMRAPAVRAE